MPQKLYWRFFSRSNYADLQPRPSFLSQLCFKVFSEQLSAIFLLAKFVCLFRDCYFQFQEHLFNSSLGSCFRESIFETKKVDMTQRPTNLSSWISRSDIMEAGRARCMVRKGRIPNTAEKTWHMPFFVKNETKKNPENLHFVLLMMSFSVPFFFITGSIFIK